MRLLVRSVLVVSLLGSLACDRYLHEVRKTVYAPTEEGLTLIYENPDPALSQVRRDDSRFQIRVANSKETPQGLKLTLTFSSFQEQNNTTYLLKNGGWVIVLDDSHTSPLFPEGFPDRVTRWEERDARGEVIRRCEVLGRATADLPGLKLPADYDRVGVWVEFRTPWGFTRRTLYLPGIGEAESRVLRNGQWVTINRLVSRGFTDAPVVKTKA